MWPNKANKGPSIGRVCRFQFYVHCLSPSPCKNMVWQLIKLSFPQYMHIYIRIYMATLWASSIDTHFLICKSYIIKWTGSTGKYEHYDWSQPFLQWLGIMDFQELHLSRWFLIFPVSFPLSWFNICQQGFFDSASFLFVPFQLFTFTFQL